jgi:hypothetical protein
LFTRFWGKGKGERGGAVEKRERGGGRGGKTGKGEGGGGWKGRK